MISILATAKINLGLNVITKRPDGYHEVDMVMQTIDLADQLSFVNHHQLKITCSNRRLPVDSGNLVWKAASLLKMETAYPGGAKIHIIKKIPIAAGLAGGSTDAAATLIGLNRLWGLGLTRDRLMEIGVKIGADVPFCIFQGTARAQGIGEQLTRINSKMETELLLVTPDIQIPTALVYQKLRLDQLQNRPRIESVIQALETANLSELESNWGNVLEPVALKEFPYILQVKEYFHKFGLSNNMMSGSGPTFFALNPPRESVAPFLSSLPRGWFGCLTKIISGNNHTKG
jgi:4-diphosphocytidyl-2-C-methyl-D-erythritol kinase